MIAIPLTLAPLRPEAIVAERDGRTVFDLAYEDLALAIEPFPDELPFGLYRLSIDIERASAAGLSARLETERNGRRERTRVVVEADAGRADFHFVLVGGERRPVLTIAVDGPGRLSIGACELARISTTRWRTRRAGRWLGARAARPQRLVADARSLIEDVRRRGVWELRRRFTEAMSPSIWSEREEIGHGLNRMMRAISVTNRDFLARLPAATGGPAASLSFVVPVFHTPRAWLEQLVASMKDQTDQDFEAVFVFDGPQPELEAALADGLDGTFRHRVLVLSENRGVSAASNAGIRASMGEFLMVVDHDDVLERHLVEAFHRASAAEPADIYYADEAITDAQMQLVRSVASRGQFDIRHYLSHPYIVHPILVRRAVAEGAGLFDETLRVSHDVDFFLRCVARARCVVQIPLVLYFWRTHATSLGHAAMDAVYDNTSAAVRAYLAGRPATAGFEARRGVNFNELDIRPPVPEGLRIAIVVPTKNGLDVLQQCVASIQARAAFNRVPADIVVIDHESDDPQTLAYLARERDAGRIQVAPHVGPWNYSAINNAAIANHVSGRGYTHVVLMNNDIELVTDDWLDRMAAEFSWGDVGVVGCCLLYPDGTIQHAGVVVGLVGPADHVHRYAPFLQSPNGPRAPGPLSALVATRDYSAVTAALMMVSLFEFEAVGGFDERLAIGFNDTDLCLRIGARGKRSTYLGSVVAIHHESATRRSTGGVDHPEDTALFRERYEAMIRDGDPYHGAAFDWTQTTPQLTERAQKRFGLRRVKLR